MANNYHRWTDEEIEFLRQHRPTTHFPELRIMLREKFGFDVNERTIEWTCYTRNIRYKEDCRFKKGHSMGAGRKMSQETKDKIAKTLKEKNLEPPNKKPVGTSYYVRDGYLNVKTEKGWRYNHILVWEEHNGKIPKGYIIRHLDGNPKNDNIDNLILVSKSANVVFNKRFKITEDAELNRVMFAQAELMHSISERGKDGKKDRKQV